MTRGFGPFKKAVTQQLTVSERSLCNDTEQQDRIDAYSLLARLADSRYASTGCFAAAGDAAHWRLQADAVGRAAA